MKSLNVNKWYLKTTQNSQWLISRLCKFDSYDAKTCHVTPSKQSISPFHFGRLFCFVGPVQLSHVTVSGQQIWPKVSKFSVCQFIPTVITGHIDLSNFISGHCHPSIVIRVHYPALNFWTEYAFWAQPFCHGVLFPSPASTALQEHIAVDPCYQGNIYCLICIIRIFVLQSISWNI